MESKISMTLSRSEAKMLGYILENVDIDNIDNDEENFLKTLKKDLLEVLG